MKSNLKINLNILLVMTIGSFLVLIFILYQVNLNLVDILNISQSDFDVYDYILGIAHIYILIFHVYTIIYILIFFRQFSEYKMFKVILLMLAIISLFSMGVEKVMVDEVAKEYTSGKSLGEFYILNFAYMVNITFTVLLFVFLLKSYKLVLVDNSEKNYVDETIFTIAQYLGILSGAMGLFMTFSLIKRNILETRLWVYIPFYVLFLLPYIVAVMYWLSREVKHRIVEWYDEKQW